MIGLWNMFLGYIQIKLQKIYNKKYEKQLRIRLKNDNFSIICSNCIGGVIYHRLGKKFLSPTINMWFHQGEFLKFVENLPKYIEKDLVFVESKYDYPVAKLGDIHLYFNHAKTEEEARHSWENRRNRIDYDNLFIIMYDRDGITEEDIRRLERIECKNKMVLSDMYYPDIDYVLTMKPTERANGAQFLDTDWFGRRTFEKNWDFVEWLNCKC